uniref:Uncharacterized protein n=1 Tax=Anguilla anguilla TaxID=7936 RepID=A0A0E9TC18_ANGAN
MAHTYSTLSSSHNFTHSLTLREHAYTDELTHIH